MFSISGSFRYIRIVRPVVSVEEAVKKLRREFADLTGAEFSQGTARAINRALQKGRTEANRAIRAKYTIKASDVSKALKLANARPSQLYGELIAQGKPIPLKFFKHKKTNKGVDVEVKKGSKQSIRSAFIATMASGHRGVFGRGEYQSRDFKWRAKRLKKKGNDTPITELHSVSIPSAFSQQKVYDITSDAMIKTFSDRMMHELSRIRNAT